MYAVGVVGDSYQGFNLHVRWDPAVFSFSSASAAGGVFDPSVGSGTCPAANTGAFDADGGGVVFGCAGYSATNASGKLLATFTLTPAASGCSKIHLYTFGSPDGGDSISGTFTVNAADFSAQANTYYDGTADTTGHTCTPPAAAPVPSAPQAQGPLAAATGHCPYDINRDGVINIFDLAITASSYQRPPSDPAYKPWADVNGDGTVNIFDLSAIAGDYNLGVTGCMPCRPNRSPDPQPTARGIGWYRSVGSRVGGAYSNILNYSGYGPWVSYGSPHGASAAWVMLDTVDGQDFAQVGWLAFPFGRRYNFIQYTDAPGVVHPYILFDNADPPGTSTYYTMLYADAGPPVFTFEAHGNVLQTLPAYFQPTAAQNAGETQNLADQMPGGSFVTETLDDGHIWINGWESFAGSDSNVYAQYYSMSGTSALRRDIWDSLCAF